LKDSLAYSKESLWDETSHKLLKDHNALNINFVIGGAVCSYCAMKLQTLCGKEGFEGKIKNYCFTDTNLLLNFLIPRGNKYSGGREGKDYDFS